MAKRHIFVSVRDEMQVLQITDRKFDLDLDIAETAIKLISSTLMLAGTLQQMRDTLKGNQR